MGWAEVVSCTCHDWSTLSRWISRSDVQGTGQGGSAEIWVFPLEYKKLGNRQRAQGASQE